MWLPVSFLQAFLPEYEKFKASIADLDRRLASIVGQGFDDCSGLEAGFKVIILSGTRVIVVTSSRDIIL